MILIFRLGLKFLQFEEPVVVTGLLQSDLNVTGANISNFVDHGDGNFSFNLNPLPYSTEINISLDSGAGQYNLEKYFYRQVYLFNWFLPYPEVRFSKLVVV